MFFSYLSVGLGARHAWMGSAFPSPGRLVGRYSQRELCLGIWQRCWMRGRKERLYKVWCSSCQPGTGKREDRQHFVGRDAHPAPRQRPWGRTWHGYLSGGLPLPRAAFPAVLVLSSANTQEQCCECSSFLKVVLALRRNKSTGAKSCIPKTCPPAVRNSDINVQQH